MPDTISISTSVSLGLLAGIVSGVCYLVANGVTWNKCEEEGSKACVRGAGGAVDDVCRRCGGETSGGPISCICQHKLQKFEKGGWFLRQLNRAMYHMPWGVSTDRLEQIDEECETGDYGGGRDGRSGDLRNVREFLEALSARLAGGDLSATSVAPLYHHHDYLPASSRSTPVSTNDVHGASSAHAQLKRLVSRVVEEAASLPALARYAAEPPQMPSLESSTYEDLLASAILNKVIERYQTENGSGGRSSGIHSASASPTPSERSSPRSLNQRHAREISPSSLREVDDASDWEEGDALEEALEVPRRVPFPEFGGDIINSTENEYRDFDEMSSSDIQAVDSSWEENWLFQRKKIKTIQSVPVPMLVPNSNTEYRAMIGDRDADDTTDLSDNASDTEPDPRYRTNTKRLLDSKHLIGGKPKIDEILDYEPDSLTFIDGSDDFIKLDEEEYMKSKDVVDSISTIINEKNQNGEDTNDTTTNINEDNSEANNSVLVLDIDSGPLAKSEFVLKEEIHRTTFNNNHSDSDSNRVNKQNKNAENVKNNMNVSLVSRHEREGEYEETVTLPVQRYADSLRRKHFDDETQQIPTRDSDIDDELLPGTIAYRERQKWLNAVDMPNNPYSPEAIQRRLSAKSTSSMFDTLTAKSKDIDAKPNNIEEKSTIPELQPEDGLEKDKANIISLSVGGQINETPQNGVQAKSPTPKILKDALAEEVPQYKRYGRDYYIKEAKSAAGARKRGTFSDTSSISSINKSVSLENFEPEFTSPGLLIKQFNTIATNQQYTNFGRNNLELESITTKPKSKSIIMIEYDDNIDTNTMYSAQPVHVNDDTDKRFEEIYETNNLKPNTDQLEFISPDAINNSFETADFSTSSLDDSIKIYNVPTGEIVKSKHFDNVSVIYESTADKNENFDIPDNNMREDTVDSISQNSDALVDALVIVDGDCTNTQLENDIADYNSEVEDILSQLPKVKEIAKKFVSMDNLNETVKLENQPARRMKSKENGFNFNKPVNKQMYMHSLTARSISKEFREELKQSMTTPLKIPGGSKEIPNGIEEVVKESSRPGSPLPEPGTIKTKLAFFESLKNKFSSK